MAKTEQPFAAEPEDNDERQWPKLSPEAQERTLLEFQRLQRINADHLTKLLAKTEHYSTDPHFAEQSLQKPEMEIVLEAVTSPSAKKDEAPRDAVEWAQQVGEDTVRGMRSRPKNYIPPY